MALSFHRKRDTLAVIRYTAAEIVFSSASPSMRRYSRVRMERRRGRNGRVARNLHRTATIDGSAQVAQKGHTGRTPFDMLSHLVAGPGLQAAIQIL